MEHTIFQMIVSGSIFVLAYILIIWDKLDRAVVAISGAFLMILCNILSQENAFREVDYNTIGLLVGMMIIVMVTKRTGIFEYIAVRTVKIAKGEPVIIMLLLSLITGVFSALLDNVTTILLIVPVTLTIAKDLRTNPAPFIISEVFASNIGGTATLIGDPPNIMIGSAAGLSFLDFLQNAAPVIAMVLFLSTYLLMLRFRKRLVASPEAKAAVMQMEEKKCIKDHRLLRKCLVVLAFTILGFMLHSVLRYESATVAIVGAVVLMLISGIRTEHILHEIEWKTIFFFIGLFIMVGGVKESGVIDLLARGIIDVTKGDVVLTTMAVLWAAAILSAFLDNIPFVATMIPMIQEMGTLTGMDLHPVWWALSFGACLGGNGTIIGASANVVAIGLAEEHGHKISFWKYLKVAFPLMLITVGVCAVYLYVFYL